MPLPETAILRAPTVTVIGRPQFTEPDHLPVQRHGEATSGEQLMEYAGRLHSMGQANEAERTTHEYLSNMLVRPGPDPLTHAHYSVLIEGVSQGLASALARQLCGFAITSTALRHVHAGEMRYVVPPAVLGDDHLTAAWCAQVSVAHESYVALVDALMTRFAWVNDRVQRRTLAHDGASSLIPNCVEAKMIMTGNANAWRTVVARNVLEDTEWECRRFSIALLRTLQRESSAMFGDFVIYQANDRREAATTRHRPE